MDAHDAYIDYEEEMERISEDPATKARFLEHQEHNDPCLYEEWLKDELPTFEEWYQNQLEIAEDRYWQKVADRMGARY